MNHYQLPGANSKSDIVYLGEGGCVSVICSYILSVNFFEECKIAFGMF